MFRDYINHARNSRLNQGEDPQRRLLKKTGWLDILLQKNMAKL
jgi:hypothetical protein